MLSRNKIIIISLVVVFLVIPLVAFGLYLLSNRKSPAEQYLDNSTKITRDRDTNTIIEDDPTLTPEKNEQRTITLIGIEAIANQQVPEAQLIFLRDKINEWAKNRLKGQYETVTIRPQDLVNDNYVFKGTLRLGQTDTLLPFEFTAGQLGETQLVIRDPENKFGGIYDSGFVRLSAD